jgi:DNA processing protein
VPENSLVRNRTIAGMPLGVSIVERKEHSGSSITARLAMEFVREVFGVPGNVTQEVSFAPNQLIKQGAKLVTSAEDVIAAYAGENGFGGSEGGRSGATQSAPGRLAKYNIEKDLRDVTCQGAKAY